VYSFAYLPTRLAHQRVIDKSALPKPETKFDLFATAVEGFLEAGYEQIGMDHFARPDDELARARIDGRLHRNFMGYTTKTTPDMVGIGMSAIGDLAGCFVQNIAKIDSYSNQIADGEFAVHRGFKLSDDDKIRRKVILSIMCNFRLNFADIESRFGIDFDDYFSLEKEKMTSFIDDGLLEIADGSLTVLPKGWIFVRNIAMEFDPYLRQERKDKRPTFSRTI
jgi:oxygen-independent coproporphyrinogen-3 oxidase